MKALYKNALHLVPLKPQEIQLIKIDIKIKLNSRDFSFVFIFKR